MRLDRCICLAVSVLALSALASYAAEPHIYQHPALSQNTIAFAYAGDLWSVARDGGRATRLTVGVGIETGPVFSPDGRTIAFTGEYDGNTDVFTIPTSGGIPHRVTYHPAADYAVGWTPDGTHILFRSNRDSASRYTQLYSVPASGGVPVALPLPMAFSGELSSDGSEIVYSPISETFGVEFANHGFVAWGNYRGGRAGTIWITTLPGLDSTEIPHGVYSDFSPVYVGKQIYFLSGRDNGHIGIFKYDRVSKVVSEVLKPSGSQIRSLAGNGTTLIYDQLGEIYLFDTASGKSRLVPIEVDADFPEVRPTIKNVAGEIEHLSISPTGVRVAVEAHGEILTVPAKFGPTRDITNTTGIMERAPAWSPDGQSIAYFSDESGLYAIHIASQTGAGAVKKFPLSPEPAYYFDPQWSPDSKRICFHDNRLNLYVLDTDTGKLSTVGDKNTFGGFSDQTYNMAWSPDSKWIVFPRSMPNHLHAIYLYSVETGKSTQVTSSMVDSRYPAFDREGKLLYFTASTNDGATSDGSNMTSDLYQTTSNIYAVVLSASEASPVAPELEDEKAPGAGKSNDAPDPADAKDGREPAAAPKPVKSIKIDIAGIESRIVALPLPAGVYSSLQTGIKGSLYFLKRAHSGRFASDESELSRWLLNERKVEKLADNVLLYQLSANGEKMLVEISNRKPDAPSGAGGPTQRLIVPANVPVKPGEGVLSFADLQVHVNPHAEWNQMFREVWLIERAYFYDPNFHGAPIREEERRMEPYLQSIVSREDLSYIFQEMLTAFSVGHMGGNGGAIPEARHLPGGLLGADYVIKNDRYCLAKILTGDEFNPELKAPLAEPGLNVSVGDCITTINGVNVTATMDIQQSLEGTAGKVTLLHITAADGSNGHDINVLPLSTEYTLRNVDWIESNRRKVDQLSGGKLAYVFLPDTGESGFTNFNRYFMAQTDKQGVIIDERFNAGGQVADYIIEVLSRHIESYGAPRYGSIQHTPNAAIYGPKVMIINEVSGSGGDAMPWLFRQAKLGPLVGKRTWGGLVGIGEIPVLMDGGYVTSPSVPFFTPKGEWDVENHGVEADVVVEQDPKLVSEGHDPQLEKAVALALQELAAHPNPEPKRPAYPIYH